jgi:hypothetical protein
MTRAADLSCPLASALRLMLPAAPLNLLLQATLLQGEAVRNAWAAWRQSIEDPKAFLASDRVGIKRHLPLVYRNLVTNRVDPGRDLEPYLRAARAREELRSARYRQFLSEALGALQQSGVEFVVGKGVTVGETIQPDPVLRHCHDIDLLVRAPDMSAAAAALTRAGFEPSGGAFVHESGLPVELHDRLYRTPLYASDLAGVWDRARPAEMLGLAVRVISDVDLLVQATVHASTVRERENLSWIIDAVSLLRRRESENMEIAWAQVDRIGGVAGARLPLYVLLEYLAATFAAPIPATVIAGLRSDAAQAGRLQHLAALDGLRACPNVRFKSILRASDWHTRGAIARAMLLPPPAYLAAKYQTHGIAPLALLYLTRPLRFVGRQIKKSGRRCNRLMGSVDPPEARRRFLARLLPEERLLLGCIRQELTDQAARQIADDLQDHSINWTIVLETAGRHGIEPLLSSNLNKCRGQGLAVPADVLKKLRGAMLRAIRTKEIHARQLRDVLEFTNRNRLSVMLIKGAALDAAVFRTPWHVVSLDIDLLIRQTIKQVPEPIKEQFWAINRNGPFECEFGGHHDLSVDGVLDIDYDALWRDARRISVHGQEVHVMCPEDMLIASCVNGCRKRFFHLKSLYSIGAILACHPDLDWERLAQKAALYRCGAIVYAALVVARVAVDADVSDVSLRGLNVGTMQAAIIRFLAARRSFTPLTGRQVMNEQQYTLWSKRLISPANLSVVLPYAAYTWRQRFHRLRWLSQTEAMSKPGLFRVPQAGMELSPDTSPPMGGN